MENKKLYFYSGLAIALSVVAYVLITKKKKLNNEFVQKVPAPDGGSGTSEISAEQYLIDPKLAKILDSELSVAKSNLLNKQVFSKIDNVNPRTQNFVNNGVISNNSIGGRITVKGTLIGTVKDVVEDKGRVKNPKGNVYKWILINPSPEAVKSINDSESWWNVPITTKNSFYVREDVISLSK